MRRAATRAGDTRARARRAADEAKAQAENGHSNAHELAARVLCALEAAHPSRAPRLCVALSGGLDSTALLTLLAGARSTRARLRAVHVNHGLSPHAAEWARQCARCAQALAVPLTVIEVSVTRSAGSSPEAAAREARYRAFASELAPGELLLTAQHADDQLETVLLQLLRGAGLPGLAAMPACAPFARGWLVRPLLGIARTQIEQWARGVRLEWVEDESNADERLDRNYLRRRVLPALLARWPHAGRMATRSARHAAEAQRLLDALAQSDLGPVRIGAALDVRRLRALSPSRRRNALRGWIGEAGLPLPDSARLAELAGPMLAARRDAQPQISWRGARIERHCDRLTLRAAPAAPAGPAELAPTLWSLTAGTGVLELPANLGRLELTRAARGPIDLEALPATLTVRARHGGEQLRPRSGGPRRTLKSLLQQARLPPAERRALPLLLDGEELLAVADLWVDARIQAGPATVKRGRLVWHRPGSLC